MPTRCGSMLSAGGAGRPQLFGAGRLRGAFLAWLAGASRGMAKSSEGQTGSANTRISKNWYRVSQKRMLPAHSLPHKDSAHAQHRLVVAARPRRALHPAGGATVADDRFLHRQRRPRRPRPFPRRQRNRTGTDRRRLRRGLRRVPGDGRPAATTTAVAACSISASLCSPSPRCFAGWPVRSGCCWWRAPYRASARRWSCRRFSPPCMSASAATRIPARWPPTAPSAAWPSSSARCSAASWPPPTSAASAGAACS